MLPRTCGKVPEYAGLFLLLLLYFSATIILHELGHHLFGLESEVSLARNWPLVPVTAENRHTALIGALAGPAVNLLLGCLGLAVYLLLPERSRSRDRHRLRGRTLVGLFALANACLLFFATPVNLVLDLISGQWNNDLQVASQLAGLNVLILPAVFTVLSAVLIRFFWLNLQVFRENRKLIIVFLLIAGIGAGALLGCLDEALQIRFSLR